MSGASLANACIVKLEGQGAHTPISCLFNPKEYSFAKQNTWTLGTAKGSNVPQFEFGGGKSTTLTMQLFFDTYIFGKDAKDVRKEYTEAIWDLMMVDPALTDKKNKKGRPPKVCFQWGLAWTFEAVITSITQKFVLFLDDGTPVRATLDVTFQQIRDESLFPKQNPTSGGVGGERMWTVKQGDTLASIAFSEYGDPGQWRAIADANNLTQVRRLSPGMVLEIPNG